jgi:hypothetical protein
VQPGISKWAPKILSAILNILKSESNSEENAFNDINIDILHGLGSLAECEVLKVRIIDEFMPRLLKFFQHEDKDVSEAATLVCFALGFNVFEEGVGWDAYLLSDKFSLGRARLIL